MYRYISAGDDVYKLLHLYDKLMQQDFAAIWLQYYNHKTTMQAEMIF